MLLLLLPFLSLTLTSLIAAFPASTSNSPSIIQLPSSPEDSALSEASINSTSPLTASFPNKYVIPSSDITFYHRKSSWFPYRTQLPALIALSQHKIANAIAKYGASTIYPGDATGKQSWGKIVDDGGNVYFGVEVWNHPPYKFTWGDLGNVLKGVKSQCGSMLCEFEWQVESGIRIGRGKVSRVKY